MVTALLWSLEEAARQARIARKDGATC